MPIALILALAPLDISFLKENGGQINASKHPNNNVLNVCQSRNKL